MLSSIGLGGDAAERSGAKPIGFMRDHTGKEGWLIGSRLAR